MSKLADIKIDDELARELREFVFEKHGTTYGAIKLEVERAIRTHIKNGG